MGQLSVIESQQKVDVTKTVIITAGARYLIEKCKSFQTALIQCMTHVQVFDLFIRSKDASDNAKGGFDDVKDH